VIRAAIRMIQRPTARDRRRLERWRVALAGLEDLDRRLT
jgi:hypothetical protein